MNKNDIKKLKDYIEKSIKSYHSFILRKDLMERHCVLSAAIASQARVFNLADMLLLFIRL